LCPLSVSVSLPPVLVFAVDDVKNVSSLEADAQLVTRNVQVVVRVVVEVRPIMHLQEETKVRKYVQKRQYSRSESSGRSRREPKS